jgi:hypothetical protein
MNNVKLVLITTLLLRMLSHLNDNIRNFLGVRIIKRNFCVVNVNKPSKKTKRVLTKITGCFAIYKFLWTKTMRKVTAISNDSETRTFQIKSISIRESPLKTKKFIVEIYY